MRFNRLMPLLLMAGAVFAADKTTFQSKPVTEYPHRMTSENVTIAAQPFLTDEEAKDAFGKLNPYRYGVMPILIVIRNEGKDTVKVDRMKVGYVLPDNTRIDALAAGDVKYLLGAKPPKGPGPTVIPGVKLGGNKKNPLAEWEIEGRAFAAKVIPPGESASGFVYFQVDTPSSASSVTVDGLSNAVTGKDLFYFEIPMSGK